jgi:transcriptional regulator with XRE-family HTH domain
VQSIRSVYALCTLLQCCRYSETRHTAVTGQPERFGKLLQEQRQAAGLSQQELAERAGLSRRGIADLERGVRNWPHPTNARRMADALALSGAARRQSSSSQAAGPVEGDRIAPKLTAAAVQGDVPIRDRGDVLEHAPPVVDEQVDNSTLPEDLTSFIGREGDIAELECLLAPQSELARLVTLTEAGGVGKSRLARRVAQRLAMPTGVRSAGSSLPGSRPPGCSYRACWPRSHAANCRGIRRSKP